MKMPTHMAKWRLLALLVWMLGCCYVQAQNRPIQVQIIVPQPLPITPPQILGGTGQTVLSLINTDPFNTYKVMIGGTLTGDNGITGTVDPRNKQPADAIVLDPGQVKFFTGDDILSIFSNYSITDIQYSGITVQELALNPIFPEGAYTICVQVYDINTGDPLSNDPPMGCTPPLIISTPDPPIITNPQPDENFALNNFQLLNFAWTPVVLPSGMAVYDIVIAQLPAGVNPYDALESQNLVWVSEEKLISPYFLYDQQYPPLDYGTYVVRVKAYDANGVFPVKNDGWSDVVSFEVSEQTYGPPFLQSPAEGQTFSASEGPTAKISWSLPTYLPGIVEYNVEVAELAEGYSPAIAFNKPALVKVQTTTTSMVYIIGTNEAPLEVGKTYAARVQAKDPINNAIFENDGWSDVHIFNIEEPAVVYDAPVLKSPTSNQLFDRPSEVSAEWLHDIPNEIEGEVSYEIKVWSDPPTNNYNSFVSQNAPIITLSNITALEQAIEDDLDYETTYLIRVQALGNGLEFSNNGYSNFRRFSVDARYTAEQLAFICGQGCEVPTVNNTVASTKFGAGDLINIGNVTVKLGQVTVSNGQYNGKGRILTSEFFTFPISVQLSNIKVNAEGDAFAGSAFAERNTVAGMPSSWRSNNNQMGMPSNPGQLLEALENLNLSSMGIPPSESVGNYNFTNEDLEAILEESMSNLDNLTNPTINIDLGIDVDDNLSNIDFSDIDPSLFADFMEPVKLPQRFGDIYITYLRLTPSRASAKLASIERLTADEHLVFGQKNVCFSAGGPAVQGLAAMLPLLEDVEVEENNNYSVHIQKNVTGAPNEGTALLFSCSPEQTLAAVGYVELRNSQIRNGNITPTYYGRFTTEWDTWSNWIAELRMINANELNTYSTGEDFSFNFRKLKGYDFKVDKLMFDHSTATNVVNDPLPEGVDPIANYSINGRSLRTLWSGLYIEEGTLLFPPYISNTYVEDTPDEAERVSFSIDGFVIDSRGLSGQIERTYTNSAAPYHLNEWQLNPEEFTIDIQSNSLEKALWTGDLKIPLLAGTFPVSVETYWSYSRNRVYFDIENIKNQELRMEGWNADFEAYGSSSVTASLSYSGEDLTLYTNLNGVLDFDTEMNNIREVVLQNVGITGLKTFNKKRVGFLRRDHVSIQSYTLPNTTQKIAGFPVMVNTLEVVNYFEDNTEMSSDKAYLRFGVDFTLDDMIGGLSTSTHFEARAFVRNTGYAPANHFIEPIYIQQSDFQGCGFSGSLTYTSTPDSYWFRGNLQGNMLNVTTSLKGHVGSRFGNKFWALEVEQDFPAPLPFVGPTMIKSMGGGLYYHMKKQFNQSAFPLPKYDFLPPPNSNYNDYGFYINTVLLTADGGKTLNGRFVLSVDLDDRGLESMSLDGHANFADEDISYSYWLNNAEPPTNAPFSVNGGVTLNFRQPYIQGSFGYRINYDDGFITGNGNDVVGFRLSPADWYVRLGQNTNRVNLQLNYGGETSNIEGYFTTGGNLSSPTTLIENIQFLLDGELKVSSPSVWVPITRKDRVKVSGQLGFTFQGDIGWNLNPLPCSNHTPAGSFFTYVGASVSPSVAIYYKESCDSWVFFFDEDDCGRYDRKFGFGISVETNMYAPRPTGFYVGTEIDLPVLDPFDIGWTIGDKCQ